MGPQGTYVSEICCEETLYRVEERSACVNLIDLERADIELFIIDVCVQP